MPAVGPAVASGTKAIDVEATAAEVSGVGVVVAAVAVAFCWPDAVGDAVATSPGLEGQQPYEHPTRRTFIGRHTSERMK